MDAVGPGPPASAPVLVTTTSCPSSLTTEVGLVGGMAKALSPSRIVVPCGIAAMASGLSRSFSGATVGWDGSVRAAITSAPRATAWSKRVRSLRIEADTSMSP